MSGNVNARSLDFAGAADYVGPGAIEVPEFETEIFDLVRRDSIALQRIQQKPATGHPHRYFEQTGIAVATAVDPRNINATPSGPTRTERPAFIKAEVANSNISLFDKDVTEQQGQFASTVAKDIEDIINGIGVLRGQMLWAGTDSSLLAPTTTQWVGLLTQITKQAIVAVNALIIDGLKTAVATLLAQQGYVVRPTAIYVNPLLNDLIDQEAKAYHIDLKTREVVAGVSCKYLSTQAGDLPLIQDPYMPTATAAAYGFQAPSAVGATNLYFAVILSEAEVEIPVISGKEYNPNPRLFQLGLTGNLSGQFVGVKFDCVIAKGASYAHTVVGVYR